MNPINSTVLITLIVLLCSVCVSLVSSNYPPTKMGNFDMPNLHTNYDLREDLNLNICDYVEPGEDNMDMLSLNPTDLKVLQLNIRGLLNKQDRLLQLLHEHKVDIALLCETWLNPNTEKMIRLPNYKIHNTNRIDKIGGGVCVLLNSKL